ncbi:MAG: galactokinase [Thermoguttaceae bacterium]|nr:galactokinase [Thermoguttaceae bacterium]MDW8036469.1 galactokinase [Thermoguttaceae bacterium]
MILTWNDVAEKFQKYFGQPPAWIVRAPGRVNLIGEHTDYNEGFVLPLAIDRAIWIALRPRQDRTVAVYSVDFQQQKEFSLEGLRACQDGWLEYLKGVAWVLQEEGFRLTGWEGVLVGDVPQAAGLSSSAALEMATARAFAAVSEIAWDPVRMALLGQRAENRWVGVQCGIMDQLVSAAGQAGHALLIDCRSLHTEPVPLPAGTAVVVLDTGTRRGLVDSAYNERRGQCERAAKAMGVRALRDVSVEQLEAAASRLDPLTFRRARHVVTENARTLEAAEAMRQGDKHRLGQLMNASHQSLRDDYEVSSDALNRMVELARSHPACYGARMTGAGFGGCAVALVDQAGADDFVRTVGPAYQQATGHQPALYVCQATQGAEARTGCQIG